MKILYVLSGTSVSGGATKSFLAMLEQVQISGHEVYVICPTHDGVFKLLEKNGVRVYATKYKFARFPRLTDIKDIIKWIPRIVCTLFYNQIAYLRILKIAKKWKPDIIHENTSVTDIGFKVASKMKIPCVIHIREYGDKDFGINLYNLNKRVSSSNVYTIPITKDIGLYRGVHKNGRCNQIYNGIINESKIRYNSNKSRYFLYAGRIEKPKGIEDLLDAYLEYSKNTHSPIPLKIAGASFDKSYLESLQKKVVSANKGHLVEWLGERGDIEDLYYNALLTIIPSYFEGLGRVLPEAMANGCLCAGRNTGGTKEQFDVGKEITGSEIGLRFSNTNELAEVLNKVTINYEKGNAFTVGGEYHKIIMRSQDSIHKNFTVESFGNQLVDFYGKIMKKNV